MTGLIANVGVKVTAVVCTRDRPTLLAGCLPSLVACTYRPREVVVVDQSADQRTRDVVRRWQAVTPDLVYVPTDTRGVSAARNLACAHASGEVVAFTDDDCVVEPGWLDAIVAELQAEPRPAAVCGRALPLVEAPLVADPVSVRTGLGRQLFERPCSPWRVGTGNNMAFDRAALVAVGAFDEQLGPGARFKNGEESDLFYRMLRRGYPVLYSPAPTVYHRQWRSPTQQIALARNYGIGIGAFAAKHIRTGDPLPLRTLGGWVVAAALDLARRLRRRDWAGAQSSANLLVGMAVGVGQMARGPGGTAWPRR